MAEVASAYVSIMPSARGFGRSLDRQITPGVAASGKKAGIGFGKLFGAAIALGVGAKAFSFLSDGVEQASGLAEAGTKIATVFGKDGSKAVQKFSEKGAKALGQNRLDVLEAAATFGVFGKSAGLGGKQLAKFSTDFTSLSTDMASFNNSTPEEATLAIGAALRGEAEPIRKFGVLLDDATLRNRALKLGLIETTKDALTPQQKVLAAQAEIYRQTGDAQGDFARTSDGLANQQRILSATFTDLKGEVGEKLLPVVTRFVGFLNDKGIPALRDAGDWIKNNLLPPIRDLANNYLTGLRDAWAQLTKRVDGGKSSWDQIKDAMTKVGRFVRDYLIPAVGEFYKVYLPGLAKAIGVVIDGIQLWWKAFRFLWNNVLQPIIKLILQGFSALMDTWATLLGVLGKVPGFGWAKDASKAMASAADQAQRTADNIKKIPATKNVAVNIKYTYTGLRGPGGTGTTRGGDDEFDGEFRRMTTYGTKVMEALNKGLDKGAERLFENLKKHLDKVQGRFDTLKSEFSSIADGVASAFTGDLFGAEATAAIAEVRDELGNITTAAAPAQSASQNFMAGLFGTSGTLTGLVAAFKKLTGLGYGAGFLAQLFQSGNAGLILDLAANGNAAQAAQVNTLFGGIETMSSNLGNSVADNKLGDKMTDVRNEIKELRKDVKFLAPQISAALNGAHANGHKNGKRT